MNDDPLHDWQQWEIGFDQKPVLIAELNSGRVNRHYVLDLAGQRMVLRRNNPNSNDLGINREHEEVILRAVSKAGVFPEIIYSSISKGILITDFVEGSFWNSSTLVHQEKLVQMVERLNDIHSIQLDLPKFDYLSHGANYWNTLLELKCSPQISVQQRHELYLDKAKEVLTHGELCHHDPIKTNIIESSGQLYFLDWEYAGCGWPSFDFAALSHEWHVDSELLCDIADCDRTTFSDAQFMYSHLCELWELINKHQGS